jgi:hypothetical protein
MPRSSEMSVDLNTLHSIRSEETELIITTAVRTSEPTCYIEIGEICCQSVQNVTARFMEKAQRLKQVSVLVKQFRDRRNNVQMMKVLAIQ